MVDAVELPGEPTDDLGLRPAAAQHFDIGADRAQRIPDFVRDAGGEPPHAGELLRADQLALGVEQMVGHPVHALRQGREVPGLGVRGAGVQVSVGHGVRRGHEALQRSQYEACHQMAPEHEKDADFERHQHHHHPELLSGHDARRDHRRRHAHQQGRSGEERQVEEQLGAERGLGAHGGNTQPQVKSRKLRFAGSLRLLTYGLRLAY